MSPQTFKEESQLQKLSWISVPHEETAVETVVLNTKRYTAKSPKWSFCGRRNLFYRSYFLQQFRQGARHYSGHADCILPLYPDGIDLCRWKARLLGFTKQKEVQDRQYRLRSIASAVEFKKRSADLLKWLWYDIYEGNIGFVVNVFLERIIHTIRSYSAESREERNLVLPSGDEKKL